MRLSRRRNAVLRSSSIEKGSVSHNLESHFWASGAGESSIFEFVSRQSLKSVALPRGEVFRDVPSQMAEKLKRQWIIIDDRVIFPMHLFEGCLS